MENKNNLTQNPIQTQLDIDNILVDSLYAPKFDLNKIKDFSEFSEPNPRLLFEAKILVEKKRIENEEIQKKLAIEAEGREKEEQRLWEIERAERVRKAEISSFWDNVGIVFFIILFVFAMILISVLSKK